jgi:hypothetical protein
MSTTDSYSSCMAYNQRAEMPSTGQGGLDRVLSRSGKGMAGILVKESAGWREYLEAELTEPLTPGVPYLVSFHAELAPTSILAVNGLGAFLSEGAVTQPYTGYIDAAPLVVTLDPVGDGKWTNICGVVVPDAAWDHITIGSFVPDNGGYTSQGYSSENAYYFIDDVVVARIDDPSCITSIGDVPPLDESADEGDDLRVYPNPANDLVNIVGDAGLFGERAVIEVFNATGKRVHGELVNALGALQPVRIPAELKEGLYLLMVRVEGQAPKSARVVVKR